MLFFIFNLLFGSVQAYGFEPTPLATPPADMMVEYPDGKIPGLDPRATDPDTASLLRYKHSFHQMVQTPGTDQFEKFLPLDCVNQVRTYLASGNTFYSEELAMKLVPLNQFKRMHPENGNTFFHWTRSTVAINAAQENNFDRIYAFLRTMDRWLILASLYGADDRKSSKGYGHHLIELHIQDDAKILSTSGLNDYDTGKKFIENRSDLSSCLPLYNVITYLILEASEVAMVRYEEELWQDRQWFYIPNPFSIDTMTGTFKARRIKASKTKVKQ